MHIGKKAGALTLSGLLALSLITPALAVEKKFSDLPTSHWAYENMMEAAGYGILQGAGDGTMRPNGTLSWGQYLTMLTRTFAPKDYQAALTSGQRWDQAGYSAAKTAGLLRDEDHLPVTPDTLNEAIIRQDAAVLLAHAIPESYRWSQEYSMDPTTLSDWNQMDAIHQQAVALLAGQYIVKGKPDGSFGYDETIKRADGTVLLMRVLELVDEDQRGQEKTITFHVINEETGEALLPDQQVTGSICAGLWGMANELDVGYYTYNYWDAFAERVTTACEEYTLYYVPMTPSEIEEAKFWEKVERGEASAEDYELQDFWLTRLGTNARKSQLLFGDVNKTRFENQAEASANMVTVSVPVWKISKGTKVSSTMSFSIHKALAKDVKAIFTEIYQDPEQFPINALGGYSWRGDTARGEHNCGTAIDINPNENYQIRDGKPMVGSCWNPGSNPYSIAPDSSVVRIFEAHGWSWGGDAWAGDSDAATGYHDYMHFSYQGG